MYKSIEEFKSKCCVHYGADYLPPQMNQLVVISEGIYEGEVPVEGIRYASPEHMSGWWLTTDLYNGDTETLKTVHYQHICDKRPDLAIYMALPYGYRFLLGGKEEHVWFDEEVAQEKY